MKRIILFLSYPIAVIVVFLFITVIITENTSLISKAYRVSITNNIESETGLKVNIESLELKWNGFETDLILNNLYLFEKKDENHLVHGKQVNIKFNLLNIIRDQKFNPIEVNLVDTDISLVYKNNKIFFKDYDLLDNIMLNNKSNDNNYLSKIKLRISDSNLTLLNSKKGNVFELRNINLVLFKHLDNIRFFTTFNHKDNNEIIHLASDFKINSNKKIDGSLYSQGMNLNLSSLSLYSNKFSISSSKVNYILWANIKNSNISSINGDASFLEGRIENRVTKKAEIIKNFKSKYSYEFKNSEAKVIITELSLSTDKNTYVNNKVLFSLKNHSLSDLSVDYIFVNDIKSASDLLGFVNFGNSRSILKSVNNGFIEKFRLRDMHSDNIKYSIVFKNLQFTGSKMLVLSNISGKIIGNSKLGRILISSKNLKVKNQSNIFKLSSISGSISYRLKNSSLMVSSNDLYYDQNQSIKLYGNFSKNKIKYKLLVSGDFNNVISKLPEKYVEFFSPSKMTIKSRFLLDYRFTQQDNKTNRYGSIDLKNIILKKPDNNISINSKNMRINFFDDYYQSLKTEYNLNNSPFSLQIKTNFYKGNIQYIAESDGIILSNHLKNLSDHKFIKSFSGKMQSKLKLVYNQKSSNILKVNLSSNMKGMSFNLISPFRKNIDEVKPLDLTMILNGKDKNDIYILFDIYKLKLSKIKNHLLTSINSPYLQGNIRLPDNITNEDRLVADLKYFDLNRFEGISSPEDYPYLDLKINQVKINNRYFNNLLIQTSPTDEGMIIEKLNFTNNYLTMDGNGKWLSLPSGQISFFDGRFVSSNFGTSLMDLGYSDIIKKGKLDSQLIGQWKGSPELFSFNNFDGKIILSLDDGEFLQVTKQTRTIGQLLGLFSISSLQKRLSLDFSDFFSSGLSFDTMIGEFVFLNSEANVENMTLKGTFGEMRINGKSNLINRTHNQKLVYIPDLSSMSLISGTLLGGPIGAVASIFYDKVLKEMGIDTNKLAAIEYAISGSWDDPKIKVIESFKPIKN